MASAELRETSSEGECGIISAEQDCQPPEAAPVDAPDDGLQGRELAAVLEALLFVSPEPIPASRLVTAVLGRFGSCSVMTRAISVGLRPLIRYGRWPVSSP